MSQDPLNSNNSWENEELTEAELDALAGGALTLQTNFNFSSNDSLLLKQTDPIFTSFDGAAGTPLAIETAAFRPMNLSLAFP